MQVISGGQLLVGEKNIFLKWQLLLKMASCGNVPSRNMNFNKRGRWFTAQNQLICWWGYSPSTRLGGVFQRWKQNPHMESGGISFQFHGSNYYLWLCFFAAIGGGYEKGFTFVTLREQYFDLGQLHIKCLGLIFARPSKFTLDKELTKIEFKFKWFMHHRVIRSQRIFNFPSTVFPRWWSRRTMNLT